MKCPFCHCTIDENLNGNHTIDCKLILFTNTKLVQAVNNTCDHCDMLNSGIDSGCQRPESCWQRRMILSVNKSL